MAKYNFNDIFDPSLIKGIEDLQNRIANIDSNIKNIGKTKMDLPGGEKLKALEEQYKKIIAQNKELNSVNKETNTLQAKAEQQQRKNEQQKKKLIAEESKYNKELIKSKMIINDYEKELKDQIRAEIDLEKAQRKEIKSLKDLQVENNRLKRVRDNLDLTQKENIKTYNELNKKILQNNNRLKNADYTVGFFQRNVGNYKSAIQGLSSAFSGLGLSLGWIGAVTMAVQTLSQVFKKFTSVNADLDQSMANLYAISGATTEEMQLLRDQAIKIGGSTKYTANQIVSLDTELSKLGFTIYEIQNSVDSIQNLASALGVDLAESAALSGAALRMFGFDASEMSRVTNVLALSASASALDFGSLQLALPYVGATAKNAGVSIEQLAAYMGVLSDNGLAATTIGTSLRDIFLDLSAKGLTWEQAMNKINTATDKNAMASQLFGKTSATAAVILAANSTRIENLNTQLLGASEGLGAATDMSLKQLDNIKGDVVLLSSAWDGLLLKIGERSKFLEKIQRPIVQFLTRFVNALANGSPFMNKMKDNFNALVGIFKEFYEPIKNIFFILRDLFSIFDRGNKAGGLLVFVIDSITAGFKTLSFVLKVIFAPIRILTKLLSDLAKLFRENTNESGKWANLGETALGKFFNSIITGIKFVIQRITALWNYIERFFNNLLGLSDRATGKFAKGLKVDKTATQKKGVPIIQDLTDLDVEGTDDSKEKPDNILVVQYKEKTDNIDLVAQYEENMTKKLLERELELRRQYGDDAAKIDIELLKDKKALEQNFIIWLEENNFNDKKIEQQNQYLQDIQELAKKEQDYEKAKYDLLYNDFQNYMQNKQLDNEKELLGMQKLGVDEVEIKRRSIVQQIELQKEYLKFLQDNANAQNEIERKKIENQIIDLENQLNKIEDPKFWEKVAKKLGVSSDAINQIKSAIQGFFNEIFNAMMNYYNRQIEKIDETIDKSKELQDQYQSNLDDLQSQLQTEEEAIRKKDELGVAFDVRERNRILKLMELEKKKVEEQKRIQEQALLERKKIEQKQQRLDIARATIGVATAVINALATQPFLVGLTLAALASATGALQISQIKAQKFAKGTNFVERNGQPKGVDTIPAWLNEGERVIDSTNNSMIPRTFPNELIPLAVHHFLSNFAKDKIGTNKEVKKEFGEKYLKEIAKNTANNKVYENGKLKSEIKGRVKITYK